MKIIDGKAIAEKIKDNIAKEIFTHKEMRPNLAIILVGDREDSKLYVSLKEREGIKVGIDTHIYRMAENVSESELLDCIRFLNNDDMIDAILVQLPLPKGFDTDGVIRSIDKKKDVDGFHPDNLEELFKSCNHKQVISPVFKAVLAILSDCKCDLKDKQVCIVSNSDIFGKSLAKVFACEQSQVEVIKPDDKQMAEKVKKADILVTAVGQPGLIVGDMIKADAVVIDIGITKKGDKVHGDVDFDSLKDNSGYITPVPGGVGPITIAMLFENTLKLFRERNKEN